MNTGNSISDELRRFIAATVPSVPFVEAILLFRSDSSHGWTVEVLARRLYIGTPQAGDLIAQLTSAGIIAPLAGQASFTYAPQDAELADLLNQLENCYRASLLEVTHLIHSKSARQAQRLADAFKFRKD
jgi:hypothetical protein